MSREIKFKYIWSNPTKTNFLSEIFTLDEIEGGKQFMVLENEPLLKNYRRVAILQWTGLLDKNGKEIYEGDIVKLVYYPLGANPDVYEYSYIELVEFRSSAFVRLRKLKLGIQLQPDKCEIYQTNYREIVGSDNFNKDICNDRIEIIGNIYEHKELITEVKNG